MRAIVLFLFIDDAAMKNFGGSEKYNKHI